MSQEKDSIEGKKEPKTSIPRKVVVNIAVSLLVPVLILVVEYRSGFFAQASRLNQTSVSFNQILFMLSILVIFLLFAFDTFRIWLQQRKFFREDYAVVSFFSILVLTVALLAILVTKLMPWNIGFAITQILLSNQASTIPKAGFADYAFLILAYSVFIVVVNQGYRGWNGGTSSLSEKSDASPMK